MRHIIKLLSLLLFVIPAEAGIQKHEKFYPDSPGFLLPQE